MIRYLIKNNIKLMFRYKWILAIMVIGPILVIALLSSAFGDLLQTYQKTEDFSVGYSVKEESNFAGLLDSMKTAGKDMGITFVRFQNEEPKDVIQTNDLAGFLDLREKDYVLYTSDDFKAEGITLEYFVNRFMEETEDYMINTMVPTEEKEVVLPVKELEYMPAVNSTDYYGIAYIVYFCWCGIICVANVLSSEKKNGILRKYMVAPVSEFKMYLAKFIPVTLVVSAGMLFTTVVTAFMYDIHWGNILLSALIVFAIIMASSAFGLFVYSIFNNVAITVILVFTSVWFMGYFGGSFETYMYSQSPIILKLLSPIYHADRALIEISCMGHSDYTFSCLGYMLLLTILCSAGSLLAEVIRKRGRE